MPRDGPMRGITPSDELIKSFKLRGKQVAPLPNRIRAMEPPPAEDPFGQDHGRILAPRSPAVETDTIAIPHAADPAVVDELVGEPR